MFLYCSFSHTSLSLQETMENAARAANIMHLCFMIQYVLMLAFPIRVLVARRELADFAQWNRKQVEFLMNQASSDSGSIRNCSLIEILLRAIHVHSHDCFILCFFVNSPPADVEVTLPFVQEFLHSFDFKDFLEGFLVCKIIIADSRHPGTVAHEVKRRLYLIQVPRHRISLVAELYL